MAHQVEYKIFRGLLKFKSNEQKIWGVLAFLSLITIFEVVLGLYRPTSLLNNFLGLKILNWIFIILTLIKAYYITWDFMHMRDEKKGLKLAVVLSFTFFVIYLTYILLVEADYIFDVIQNEFLTWDF